MRGFRTALVVLALVALSGCSTNKDQVSKAQALQNWDGARAQVLIGLARDQYANGAFDKARQSIDGAIKMYPQSAPAHVLSAKLYIESGQLEAAERELTTARQLDPTSAEADYMSGVVYQRWQQPERALECYQHACDKAPAELAYVLAKAEMLVDMDRRPEALAMLQERVTYFEHSGAIRDEVGLLLMQAGRTDEAIEMLRRASILASDDMTIREHLAGALYGAQHFEDALEVLLPLIKVERYSHRPDLLAMTGDCLVQTGQAGQAIIYLQQSADLQPNSPGIWLSLAKAELQVANLNGADSSLRRRFSLAAEDNQSDLLLGYLRLRQDRLPEALEAFQAASDLDSKDTVSLCMVGFTLEKLGRPDQATGFYRRALSIKPQDEMAMRLMNHLNSHE